MQEQLQKRLAATAASPTTLTPRTFREEGTVDANVTGKRSRIARLRANTLLRLHDGRSNPFRVAVPAYESFTSDGTADNTETFDLSHDVLNAPVTQSVDVWLGGSHYGNPDAVDFDAGTVDVTDSGTDSTVHVWYTSSEAATLELVKSTPNAGTNSSQELYSENLRLVHQTEQQEQAEFLKLNQTPLQEWVAEDMALDVYARAPYSIRFEDPDGDGAYPTNALLNLPAHEAKDTVPGMAQAVRDDMGQG